MLKTQKENIKSLVKRLSNNFDNYTEAELEESLNILGMNIKELLKSK